MLGKCPLAHHFYNPLVSFDLNVQGNLHHVWKLNLENIRTIIIIIVITFILYREIGFSKPYLLS